MPDAYYERKISVINENVESIIQEHTRGIEIKNRELAEYTFINAHMLRALSRILGLTSLIKRLHRNFFTNKIQVCGLA